MAELQPRYLPDGAGCSDGYEPAAIGTRGCQSLLLERGMSETEFAVANQLSMGVDGTYRAGRITTLSPPPWHSFSPRGGKDRPAGCVQAKNKCVCALTQPPAVYSVYCSRGMKCAMSKHAVQYLSLPVMAMRPCSMCSAALVLHAEP